MSQSGEELLPETQPVKVSSLHMQGDENVVEPKVQEPEKEDESERKLGIDESMAQHETQPLKASPLHGMDHSRKLLVQENDVDAVVVETQTPEAQTQTLVETKFREPEPDERNLGHSDKEADENSKGVVQNLEQKVGVNAFDNANIPEDDEVIDQFAQEENENGALENDAMAEYELNKEEIAAAEASSSGN